MIDNKELLVGIEKALSEGLMKEAKRVEAEFKRMEAYINELEFRIKALEAQR